MYSRQPINRRKALCSSSMVVASRRPKPCGHRVRLRQSRSLQTLDSSASRRAIRSTSISPTRSLRRSWQKSRDALDTNNLESVPVFAAGLSLGGTRALKLAIFLDQHRDEFWLNLRAIAVADAPLDMERFWYGLRRSVRDQVHPAAVNEGQWVTYLLEKHLRGTPESSYDRYVSYSPYTHTAEDGGNAEHLVDIPIRAYHEPDIQWWMTQRGKTYYQMNSIDLAAMINTLTMLGSESAELVTTHDAREGLADKASPHTWSIVDNADLVGWFKRQL